MSRADIASGRGLNKVTRPAERTIPIIIPPIDNKKRYRLFCCASSCCIGLFVMLTIVFASLFGWAYASWQQTPSCRLTYDTRGAISEKQMQEWAAYDKWELTFPRYSRSMNACVCDEDPDPTSGSVTSRKTPVWIAPVDIATLYSNLPPGFPRTAKKPEDHVKACVVMDKIVTLFAKGNCHTKDNDDKIVPFTGWDGDLYCAPGCTDAKLTIGDSCHGCGTMKLYFSTDQCKTIGPISCEGSVDGQYSWEGSLYSGRLTGTHLTYIKRTGNTCECLSNSNCNAPPPQPPPSH